MLYKILKRISDFVFAVILLVLTGPFILVSALILLLELREFPFLLQERGITLEKKRIKILKLRTIPTTHVIKSKRSRKDIFIKPDLQKAIPLFARWLRKSGLDELPQLVNVLLGQMSFVGPRPLMLSDLMQMKKHFPNHYKERQKFTSKPGITGMWQIFGDREEGINNLIALEYIYEQSKNILLDFKLALLTIPIVLQAKNSDAILLNQKVTNERKSINLNLSYGFKLKIKKDPYKLTSKEEKKHKDYVINLPYDWWYSNDSYKIVHKSGKEANIIDLAKYRKQKLSG